VLDFFEDLGSLLREGRLDEGLAYGAFCYYAKGWWAACKEYVYRVRTAKMDPTLFSEFEFFADQMIDLDSKKRHVPRTEVELGAAETGVFLNEEYAELS
jgi:hypothetical protein